MPSKKILRQLRKAIDVDDVEKVLSEAKSWVDQAPSDLHPLWLKPWVSGFESFLESIDQAYEHNETELSRLQRSLELSSLEVEQRNRDLRLEIKKVSNLLNNMRQAVFAVNAEGFVSPPVSSFARTVFGTNIENAYVLDVLFSEQDKESEASAKMQTALHTLFGEDEIQWLTMENFLPRRLIRHERVLKITCSPLWDEANLLEKVLFIIEDITDVEALARQIDQERARSLQRIQLIQEILPFPPSELLAFFDETRARLLAIQNSQSQPDEIRRLLHTIKGDSRTYGFGLMATVLHEVEVRLSKLTDWHEDDMRREVAQIGATLQEYEQTYTKIFGQVTDLDEKRTITFSEYAFQRFKETVDDIVEGRLDKNDLRPAMDRLFYANLGDLRKLVSHGVKELGLRTGKDLECRVEGDDLLVTSADYQSIWKILQQLLSNSVDHGIEAKELRMQQGKASKGSILVSWQSSAEGLSIVLKDDGAGIDGDRLLEKAISEGLVPVEQAQYVTREQKLLLIFEQGLSSKDESTEVSGMGVGMDVVRSEVRNLQGRINVESEKGRGTSIRILIGRYKAVQWQAA